MQSLELASRLIKRWGLGLGNMPVDVQQSLLDCINAGIQIFYALAPSIYREATITGVLAAPQTINTTVTQGSATFSGWTATNANYFATIRIPTDTTTDNLIVPPNSLQQPFQGVTGTQPALLFGDTIPLQGNIERVIDEPALLGSRWRLQRNDEYWGGALWDGSIYGGPFSGNGVARRVGIPRTYWVESNAQCLGNSPAFILRVDPLPAGQYTLRMRALFYALKLTMGNLQANVTLPFNDAWMESMVIPLIIGQMTTDTRWSNKTGIAQALADVSEARTMIKNLSPMMEKPNYRCETTPGW